MIRKYSKDIVIKRLYDGRPYQRGCVNYTGVSKENENYLELLSRHILEKKDFDLMEYECREEFVLHGKNGYRPKTQSEKGLCRFWYYKGFDEEELCQVLGKPIEYELNLFGNRVNIDLISYDKSARIIHLIEAKGKVAKGDDKYSSPETLLRCALEIKTYYETLIQRKNTLIKQLMKAKKIDSANVMFELDVLVPMNDYFKEQTDKNKYPRLNELLKKWGISVRFYKDFVRNY